MYRRKLLSHGARSEDYLEKQVADIQQELNNMPTVSKLVTIVVEFILACS